MNLLAKQPWFEVDQIMEEFKAGVDTFNSAVRQKQMAEMQGKNWEPPAKVTKPNGEITDVQ
jgi:hypothetical protein